MKKRTGFFANLGILLLLVLLDLLTKYLAERHLRGTPGRTLIPGVLQLQYVQNFGAAFGSLQGMRLPLILFALGMIGAVLFLLWKYAAKEGCLPERLCLILLGAGAVGNLADRLWKGYVTDFIYFSLIDFPVFNVADICVTVGCALLLILLLQSRPNRP